LEKNGGGGAQGAADPPPPKKKNHNRTCPNAADGAGMEGFVDVDGVHVDQMLKLKKIASFRYDSRENVKQRMTMTQVEKLF
jgi:hypothetical protein